MPPPLRVYATYSVTSLVGYFNGGDSVDDFAITWC